MWGCLVPDSVTTLLAAGLAAVYAVMAVLLLVLRRSERADAAARLWLLLTLVVAAAAAGVYALPADAHTDSRYEALFVGDLTQPVLAVILVNLVLVLFGTQMLHYLQVRRAAAWLLFGAAWWAAHAALSATTPETVLGQRGWFTGFHSPLDVPAALAFAWWLVGGVILVLAALYAFYRARLSEIANQALFGLLIIPPVVVGMSLGASGTPTAAEIGWVMQAVGLVAAAYGALAYRVFDIRRTLRRVTSAAILTLLPAAIFFGLMMAARQVTPKASERTVILAALALAAAIAYMPVRLLIQSITGRLLGDPVLSAPQILRRFSEDITGVVELDAVVDVTMKTLAEVLGVRRGGLIMALEEPGGDALLLEPLQRGMGEMPDIKGRMRRASPFYRVLFRNRAPLLHYDVDFGSAYASAPADEKAFLRQLRMSAYAPVVVQGRPVGILCSGAKTSDDPYTAQDLDLLVTLANQAGVALRNARLVADLRRREAEQAELNRALQSTKEQLEKLDSVKTDFITIASHELRTPLAQIRGYTDIMEAMNEQGMLDQDQTAGMTANLRKAADRLENLIGAMLDVSQLDVNAMDLRFAPTSIENVMRLAIEPLTESIKQRRLMLSARGLRDLPSIQADSQRLVQAFRNIVLNAIKYTPDGGRIDISGRQEGDFVLVAIKDSGIGIDKANHALIFEKFFRAHDPNLHSTGTTKFMGAGPGLGLTIAKGVVDAHGGRIEVDSPGFDPENFPGSTFTIVLPIDPPADRPRLLPLEGAVSLAARGSMAGVSAQTGGGEPTLARPPEGWRD